MSDATPIQNIQKHPKSFLFVFFVVLIVSFGTTQAVASLMPKSPSQNPTAPDKVVQETAVTDVPTRIVIPAIDIDTDVSNPTRSDIETLDAELLKGAVRYPGSALLGEKGNVLIFGHSSYLPVVHNQAYKAFNDIQHLKENDEIRVYSALRVYIFGVESVEKVSAKSTEEIVLDAKNNILTLVTCNTFGAKSDRFLLKATLRSIETL